MVTMDHLDDTVDLLEGKMRSVGKKAWDEKFDERGSRYRYR